MVSSMHSVGTLKCDGVWLVGVSVLNKTARFSNGVHGLSYRFGDNFSLGTCLSISDAK